MDAFVNPVEQSKEHLAALRELGITEEVAAKIGLRLYKIGMPWPLEPEGVRQFAVGLEEIFIVEERREIVEPRMTRRTGR